MDIKTLAEQYNDYIIDRRRYYHTCPELSGEEKNTRAHLKEDLEALGITDIHEMETCYGLTATIHGGKPGKTVALRADIDALPVKEETGLPFASHNEGKYAAYSSSNPECEVAVFDKSGCYCVVNNTDRAQSTYVERGDGRIERIELAPSGIAWRTI